MDYAKGVRISGGTGTNNWQELKNNGICFVVINGSTGENDSPTVAGLIQEAYDNKVPAIIETIFDPNYYKHYGGVEETAIHDDQHLSMALKGLSHKTCYGFWIASYDSNDIPWNATALGHFVDRIRHELNLIPLRGSEFPIGIRISQGWYSNAVDQDSQNRMAWFHFKPDWLISADWRYPLTDVMNPGVMNRDSWEFMEYADGKYIYNGIVTDLYDLLGFIGDTNEEPTNGDEEPGEDNEPVIVDMTEIHEKLDGIKSDLATLDVKIDDTRISLENDLEHIKKHFI